MSCSNMQGAATVAAPAAAPARPILHDPDGLIALALELIDDNPFMQEFEALARASEMLDCLDAVAADWDAGAAAQGNPDAAPLFVCLVETLAA